LAKIHDAFVQFLDMLRTNLSVKDFDAVVPSLTRLISEYRLDPSVAFAISRPSIQYLIDETEKADEAAKEADKEDSQSSDPGKKLPNGDVEMTEDTMKHEPPESKTNGVLEAIDPKEKSADDVTMGEISQPTSPTANAGTSAPQGLHPVLKDLMEGLNQVLPEEKTESISMAFYVRFWHLALGDMIVPPYDQEAKRLGHQLELVTADRSDPTVSGARRKEQEKKRLSQMLQDLTDEFKAHFKHQQTLRKKIIASGERDIWFVDFPVAKQEALSDALIQECFIPRIDLSPMDALYTAKFIFWVHKMSTPGFRTMHILDHMLREKQLTALLFRCTEKEAKNLSVFMSEIFGELRRWHADSALYEREALGPRKDFPGFARKLRDDNMGEILLGFEDFRRLLFKWHQQLHNTIKVCLQSGEYMHIRNAFQLLKGVHGQFPIINYHGNQIYNMVSELSSKDPREDIKLSAVSLLGDLKKHRTKWVPTQAFRQASPPYQQKKYNCC
jgi:THO complex subunit 2